MKQFKCKKCGNRTFRRKQFKVKGKSMTDYRRKLSKENPASYNRLVSKVICKKCGHAQRFK